MLSIEIKQLLQKLYNTFFASGGVNGNVVLTQISYLLYYRWICCCSDSVSFAYDNRPVLYSDLHLIHWDDFSKETPDAMFRHFRGEVLTFIEKWESPYNPINRYNPAFVDLINQPDILADAVSLINRIYKKAEEEHLDNLITNGEIYSYLLNQLSYESRNNIKTPIHLANFICALLKPNVNDIVLDPSCNNGTMLISASKQMMQANAHDSEKSKDEDGLETLSYKGYLSKDILLSAMILRVKLYGCERDKTMAFFTSMNLLFHGISNNVICEDALSEIFETKIHNKKFSVILSNPPFNSNLSTDKLSIGLRNKGKRVDLLYILKIIDLLEDNGRAAVIVPDGALFSKGNHSVNIRRTLLEECRIDAIISLPIGAFLPFSSVKTSIILFTKNRYSFNDRIWFYKLESDGYSLNKNRKKLNENPLPKAVEWFNNKMEMECSLCIDINEIRANGYDLSLERYSKLESIEEEIKEPKELITEIVAKEKKILEGLEELQYLLGL